MTLIRRAELAGGRRGHGAGRVVYAPRACGDGARPYESPGPDAVAHVDELSPFIR